MKIEILGAGGAQVVPRAFCSCPPCIEARAKGIPYTRFGPSMYIHDLHLLIDTPEESVVQLNRAGIERVDHLLYSHWHPDHTAGMRVLEMNWDVNRTWDVEPFCYMTEVYLPQNVAETFGKHHGLAERLAYLERIKVLHQNVIPTGESITICEGNLRCTVTPFVLWEDYACGYFFETDSGSIQKRFVICMDEVFNWVPPEWLGKLDLIIMPAGMFDLHPLTGARLIPEDHPILRREATFDQVKDILHHLNADKVVFSHLNESDRLTFDEYVETARVTNLEHPENGLPIIQFAYDGLIVEF